MRNSSVQLNIRLTEDEHQKLLRSMEKSKLSASSYVRTLITGHSPKECPPLEFHELTKELQHVSMQLTSIFHLIRITKRFDETDVGLLDDAFQADTADNPGSGSAARGCQEDMIFGSAVMAALCMYKEGSYGNNENLGRAWLAWPGHELC